MSYCPSVQERRKGQGQLAEDRGRRGKGMSRRYLGCKIERLLYQMLVAGLLLSSRERMTLEIRIIFSDLFLTQCHTNLRGWGYIFIVDQDSQTYVRMLV
jgi:hypothetical protein